MEREPGIRQQLPRTSRKQIRARTVAGFRTGAGGRGRDRSKNYFPFVISHNFPFLIFYLKTKPPRCQAAQRTQERKTSFELGSWHFVRRLSGKSCCSPSKNKAQSSKLKARSHLQMKNEKWEIVFWSAPASYPALHCPVIWMIWPVKIDVM